MIFFRSDYSSGAHPRILEAFMETRNEHWDGYGDDDHCEKAKELIKKRIGRDDSDVHFMVGGTPTNLTSTAAFLRPHEAVLAPSTAHVYVHETGALEATGHKIYDFENAEGKLTPQNVHDAIITHEDEHMVKPKMIYVSQSTEIGTIYSKKELQALRDVCDEYGLYFYMDGARLASALTSGQNDCSIEDIAQLTDAFYIGGTKNGFMFGEALVINNEKLKPEFRYILKQRGGLLAKGWQLGLQFEVMFEDNLYFDLAAHSNKMAEKLTKGISDLGYGFEIESYTNQIFPVFNEKVVEELEKDFFFYRWHPMINDTMSIRLVTSWVTKEEEVDKFIEKLTSIS